MGYPFDFYKYGQDSSERISDTMLAAFIAQLKANEIVSPLKDGNVNYISQGDSMVLRMREGGIIRTIVAKDYFEFVETVQQTNLPSKPIVKWWTGGIHPNT